MKEYMRWAKKLVQKAIETRRVVIISGSRQVGKSTLTKQSLLNKAFFRTLDDTNMLQIATEDPKIFLKHNEKTLVIDEIQKAPSLLSEIKMVVDNNNDTGQFVLTGAADVKSLPEVNESLAGRVKNIRLRSLTQGEILGTEPTFLQKAFNKNFSTQIKECNKYNILDIAIRGGYPEAVRLKEEDRKEWYQDYLNTILTKDLKDISNIKRQDVLHELVEILASWSSKYMDINGICSSLQISKPTILEYIGLIEKLFLSERLPAWIKTDYDRVGRKDKFFMADTGLLSAILNWNKDSVLFDADKSGKIIETLVFHELSAQIDLSYENTLYHYRDRTNREIDFIVENKNKEILGIEVKSGYRINKDDFKHLKWFKENLVKDKKFTGIILYSGENTFFFADDMLAVPIATLWG